MLLLCPAFLPLSTHLMFQALWYDLCKCRLRFSALSFLPQLKKLLTVFRTPQRKCLCLAPYWPGEPNLGATKPSPRVTTPRLLHFLVLAAQPPNINTVYAVGVHKCVYASVICFWSGCYEIITKFYSTLAIMSTAVSLHGNCLNRHQIFMLRNCSKYIEEYIFIRLS